MGLSFDGGIFTRSLVGFRAKRKLRQFFDGLGPEVLALLVQENEDILPFLPADSRGGLEQLASNSDVQKAIFDNLFTPDDVISWIPEKYQAIILRYPHGRDWAIRQIGLLRNTFLTG